MSTTDGIHAGVVSLSVQLLVWYIIIVSIEYLGERYHASYDTS